MSETGRVNILLVEDSSEKRRALASILSDLNTGLITVSSGAEALKQLSQSEFALVFIDMRRSGDKGVAIAEEIRSQSSRQQLPILLLAAAETAESVLERASSFGLVDFITSPWVPAVIKAKVAAQVELYQKHKSLQRLQANLEAQILQSPPDGKLADELKIKAQVLASMSEGVSISDEQGYIVYTNAAEDEMFGYGPGELIGQHVTVQNYYSPEENSRIVGEVIQTLKAKGKWAGEWTNKRKDGTAFTTFARINTVEVHGKTFFVCVQEDITERKLTEERVREREVQLRFVTDHAAALIVHCDRETRFKFVNSPYAQRFGLQADQLVGKRIAEVVGTEAYETFRPYVERALDGERVEFEVKIPYKNIGTRWMHCVYAPQRESNGTVSGFVGVLQDVTRRKETEEALRASEARFRALVSQATVGIVQWDVTGRFILTNPRFCEIIGYSEAELLDMRMQDLTYPEDLPKNLKSFDALVGGGPDFVIEKRYVCKNGHVVWVSVSVGAVRDGNEIRHLVGVVSDISERKHTEAALAQAMIELEQTNQKLEKTVAERTAKLRDTIGELEAFSYSVSHDMRSPLRAMQGFSKALLDDYSDNLDADGRDLLNRIEKGARRLDLLTRDVLAYSKVAKGEFELHPIDLNLFIPEIIRSFEFHSAKIQVAHSLPSVLGHEALISQIVSNLVGNAIKFTPRGVTPEIRIYTDRLGDKVRIWVQDNGIGISPSHFKRIFEIFGRVYSDKDYEGTGIGLAIVKKAVDRLGGEIGVESELGQGSRFWFTLNPNG